jgi:hypothetical protein
MTNEQCSKRIQGDYVLDMERDGGLMVTMQAAVFAEAAGPLCDQSPQGRVHQAASCLASQARALA